MAYSIPDKPYAEKGPLDLSEYIKQITEHAKTSFGRQDEVYGMQKDAYGKNRKLADDLSGRALNTMDEFNRYATRDQDLYAGTYIPAMKEQMDFARGYTTPDRMAANRAGAGAQNALAFKKTREGAERALQGIGVNPASGRSQGLQAGLDAADFAARAGAMTKSDRDTEALGQEYLDRAIKTGAGLPGQAVNEASMALASGNQALNAPLAADAAGLAGMTNTAHGQLGTDQFKEWAKGNIAETEAGQNAMKITNEGIRNNLAQAKQQSEDEGGSGIGALLGTGLGIAGTVAGAYFGGPMGASLGGSLGSSLGGAAGGSGITRTGRSGFGLAATGGKVRENFRFRAGGMVTDIEEEDDDPDAVPLEHRGYRPKVRDEPGRPSREPFVPEQGERTQRERYQDWTDTDTSDDGGTYQGPSDRYEWRPNYNTGGMIDAFANGGEVDEEGNVYPPEMMEEEPMDLPPEEGTPPEEGNMVPPEASPSGGAEVDDVHAMVSEGEFVMPKDVTGWFGEKFMQNLINKARKEMAEPKAEGEPAPAQAMALSPPTFQSEGASTGASYG